MTKNLITINKFIQKSLGEWKSIRSTHSLAFQEVENSENPEDLYKLAILDVDSENYDLAQSKFEDIEFKFPLSNEAIQSQIMSAFIEYVKTDNNLSRSLVTIARSGTAPIL